MRTLKKTLCLVLVLAMVMSCGVFASADFSDADEIENTVAVGVLSGMGVITGYPDGTFRPEGTLTRAEAAVILARILDAADISGTAPFTDLEGYDWAEDAIAYCAAEGIVDGIGDGKFNPGGTLTGYAWAKMLLGAVGYDAAVEGMTGASWEIAVAKLAKSEGLFGSDTSDKTQPVSRDAACAYAWNALQVGTRSYTVSGSSVSIGDINITPSKTLNAGRGASLGEANFGLTDVLEDTDVIDAYGRPYAYFYTNGRTGNRQVVYYAEVETPVIASTTVITAAALQKALGKTATVDGEALANIGANGTVTEIYATATKDAYVSVSIPTYVWTLTEADIVKANAAKDIKAGILLGSDNLKFETTEAFQKGDVVLYTLDVNGSVETAELAPYITGAITATATTYVRVNGEKMYLSANNDRLNYGDDYLAYVDGKTEVVLYLDNAGYIIDAAEIADIPVAVPTDYTFVIKTQSIKGENSSSDLFGETAGKAAAAKAQILDLETGEVKIVDLGITTDKNDRYVYAEADGSASTTEVTTATTNVNAIVEYAVLEDGSYVLVGEADTQAVTAKKGVASVATGLTATSKTVLKVVEYSVNKAGAITGAEVTTTTGIANFPKDGVTYENAVVSTDRSGKIVTEILVVRQKVVVDVVTPATYAVYLGAGEKTDVQYYQFSVGGEVVNYALTGDASIAGLREGDIVTIVLTNGKLSEVASTTAVSGKIDLIDETFIVVDGNVKYLAETYTIIDAASDYAVSSIAVDDNVEVYTNSKGEVEFIVILPAAED